MIRTALLFLTLVSIAGAQDSLQEQLDARSAEAAAKFPTAVRQVHQDGINQVGASGIYASVKKVGDAAPDFTLKNATGADKFTESLQLTRMYHIKLIKAKFST